MTPQQFSAVIGYIESGGNYQRWGDAGRAMGRFQMHPDEMWTWAHRLTIAPELNETWDSFIERLVEAFYSFHLATLAPVEVAMTYHEGHVVKEGDPSWDAQYAQKFNAAAAGLV